ncbi:MAG: hypothetical protein U1E36_09340 [Rickettsiales bacterium]
MSPTEHPRSTRYTWNEESPINRLEAELDSDGFFVVRIFPKKEMGDGALSTVPSMLHRYGFQDAYPDVKDDQDVLVLANVKDLRKLVHALSSSGFVSGTPTIEAVNGSVKKITEKEAIDTVKWHGRVGLIGHASILAAGVIQKPFDWGRIINAPLGAS